MLVRASLNIFWDIMGHQFQFSCSVVSDFLQPHEPQHAQPPYPSPIPGVYQNSCPSSRWCYATISSSVIPFSSHLQSFPASGSFQMSQLFTWGGQNIGVSASTSVLPLNTQDWFPLGWTSWISLQSKGLSRVFSSSKASVLRCSAFFTVQLSHLDMNTGKTIALTRQTFVDKVMSLLRFVITFLPRRRKWQPTLVLLPGKSQGRRSLVGCSPHLQWFWSPKK